MATPNSIDTELIVAEEKVRYDRQEIARAMAELKIGARDTAKPYATAAIGVIGSYILMRLAHRFL